MPPAATDARKAARGPAPVKPSGKPANAKPSAAREAAAALPPVTFENVRLLVADGQKSREREGLLLLDSQHVTILDKPGGTSMASVAYSALTAAFLSRSKQPRWRLAQGKEESANVDLGKLGFLKSERNWLIMVTAGAPVIFRCEDGDLQRVLAAFHERSLVPVQRYTGK